LIKFDYHHPDMTRKLIIERTLRIINQLPVEKAEEISDFADFLFKKYEDQLLAAGIQKMATDGQSFEFLLSEEDIYTTDDLKEIYNGQR
jgi:hypothetical protein